MLIMPKTVEKEKITPRTEKAPIKTPQLPPVAPSDVPTWFGWNEGFRVKSVNPEVRSLCLENCKAIMTLCPAGSDWLVQYHNMLLPESKDSLLEGKVWLEGDELRQAFRIEEEDTPDGVAPGKFMRKGDYLNIPGSGSGDSTAMPLSIFLTPEIKQTVRELVGP